MLVTLNFFLYYFISECVKSFDFETESPVNYHS